MCKDLTLAEALSVDYQMITEDDDSKLNIGLDYLIVKFVLPKL
jgi:hypothetical protein